MYFGRPVLQYLNNIGGNNTVDIPEDVMEKQRSDKIDRYKSPPLEFKITAQRRVIVGLV